MEGIISLSYRKTVIRPLHFSSLDGVLCFTFTPLLRATVTKERAGAMRRSATACGGEAPEWQTRDVTTALINKEDRTATVATRGRAELTCFLVMKGKE